MKFRLIRTETRNFRIISGMAAHGYSQIITVVVQFVSLPLFLSRWSAEQYGSWLLLSAIPGYLVVSDVGILTATANLMSMHQARNETEQVNKVFSSGLMAILVLLPTLGCCAGALLFFYSFGLSNDQRSALFFLVIFTLLYFACAAFDAVYRPFGKYPRGTFLLTTARVFDWAGTFAGLFINSSLTSVALGQLAGRIAATVIIFILARREVPQIRWNLRLMDGAVISRLLRSGFAYLSFPVGYSLTFQGMILLVGGQLGAGAVAIFSSSRTLARLLAQISDVTARAMSPEISSLYGAGRESEAVRLSKKVLGRVVLTTLLSAIALVFLGPTILRLWSHGKIPFSAGVFDFLISASIFSAYWQIQSVRLTASNRHGFLATIYLLVSMFALVLAYLTLSRFGAIGAAAAICFVEVAMIVGSTIALHRVDRPKRQLATDP